jgi:hypothetical protein
MKTILPPLWKVPSQIAKRLGESAGRQRAMFADGHLLLVLHEPPLPGKSERTGRLFWRAPDGAWQSTMRGTNAQALKRHLAEFAERIEQLDDELEAADRADDYFRVLQAVTPLHRTAHHLHATLQQAREAIPDDRDLIIARDSAYDIERSLELLQTDAKNGLDLTVARHAETQSERTYHMAAAAHRLNLLAAIFLPVATLASIFAMHLPHGLEPVSGNWMFWCVPAVGLVVGSLLTLSLVRRPISPLDSPDRKSGSTERRRKLT